MFGSRKVDRMGVVTADERRVRGMGLEGGLKGWRSTIRTSHLNFSPPKPHGCPHSDLYQASFTPSSSPPPPSHTPQPVLSHPSLLRYYTRLTFATLTLFDCTETFWKTGNRFSSYILLLESILINFPSPLEISISIRLLYFSLLLQF